MGEFFNLEDFPTSESAKKMIGQVSDGFYERSYVGKWLFQVMGLEYDTAMEVIQDLSDQLFPETATWGLMYHEIKWGLPVRPELSYEARRRLLYTQRDSKTPMTPYRMEQYLENVTGLEVHVFDVNDPGNFGQGFSHPNRFHVTVIGDSALELSSVCEALDKIKQSHTTYEIEVLERRYEVCQCTYAAIAPQTKKTYRVEVL